MEEEVVLEPNQELLDLKQKILDLETGHKSQLAGLNRKNTELTKDLDDRIRAGQTVEERIAALETENLSAVRRADAVEAFGQAGLKDEWRQLFTIKDPAEQAKALTSMLSEHTEVTAKKLASEFSKSPDDIIQTGKRSYTLKELEGKSPREINALWETGRVTGIQA